VLGLYIRIANGGAAELQLDRASANTIEPLTPRIGNRATRELERITCRIAKSIDAAYLTQLRD